MRQRPFVTGVLVVVGLVFPIYGFLFGSPAIMAIGAATLAAGALVSYVKTRTSRD